MGAVAVAPKSDQRVVIENVSWEIYSQLVDDSARRGAPRFTFDQGTLEIMSPGSGHERDNRTLARIVWLVALELGVEIEDVGSMTYRRASAQRGFEPDSSFYLRQEGTQGVRREIDPEVDPPPDLVIEIDITKSSLPKLSLFATLKVPEVWRWDGEHVTMHLLRDGAYHISPRSRLLPALTPAKATEFLNASYDQSNAAWHRFVATWARAQ